MNRHDNPGIGNLIISLSRKMDNMQQEISGLRQEVKTLTFLVRELSSPEENADRTDPNSSDQ